MNRMIDQLLWLSRLRNPKDAIMRVEAAVVAAVARFTPALETGKITVEIADDLSVCTLFKPKGWVWACRLCSAWSRG